jgi:hypothetical protein
MIDLTLAIHHIREQLAMWLAPWLIWNPDMSLELDRPQQRVDELEGR